MKILYYDCFAGISGDMHLGAMIDAGVGSDYLRNELKKLPVAGFHLHIYRDKKQSIEGTRVDVILDDEHVHGHDHAHSQDHAYEQDHAHSQDHAHKQHHNHKSDKAHHPHRNLDDIEQIIAQSGLANGVKTRARNMFRIIAEAEAKIHGVSVNEIHFHEVGALDSIVDIIGTAICLEYLKPDRILCSTVELGSGTIRCAHGTMPVPAPATAEILKDVPVSLGGTGHEATTPTGAAILAASVDEFTDNLKFRPAKTAYGIGKRDATLPNVLRVFVGEAEDAPEKAPSTEGGKIMVECNIDDMNPEFYSHVMDVLFASGANDVYTTPTIMKKSRPGVILSVVCDPSLQETVSEIILKETTSLGVRSYPVSRMMLDRDTEAFESSLGPVSVKKAYLKGALLKWKPEFDDCKKLAEKHGLTLGEVYRRIGSEYSAHSSEHSTHSSRHSAHSSRHSAHGNAGHHQQSGTGSQSSHKNT